MYLVSIFQLRGWIYSHSEREWSISNSNSVASNFKEMTLHFHFATEISFYIPEQLAGVRQQAYTLGSRNPLSDARCVNIPYTY